jgi:hypothetical protein
MSNRAKWAHWKEPPPPSKWSSRIGFGVLVALALFLIWGAVIRGHIKRVPNDCPIDGAPAQLSKRTGEHACEYSHFSDIERHMHTWTAGCVE